MVGSLMNWMHARNEGNILNKAIAHVQKTLECVVEFERGLTLLLKESNTKVAYDAFNRVNVLEHEADILRREIMHSISQSEMPADIREDLIHLINRIDHIANASNGAARRIMPIKDIHIKSLGPDVAQKMLEIVHFSVEAAKILFNLFKKLPQLESKDIFQYTDQIDALEHKCDVLHSEIYTLLNLIPSFNFNPFIAIEISKFVDLLEEISDKVEDVADYIDLVKTSKR